MSAIKTKVSGEYTYPSDFSELPDGALNFAKNVVINRKSIAEPRRGLPRWRAISADLLDRPDQLLVYKDTLIAAFDSKLSRNAGDPFTLIPGVFAKPNHGDAYTPKLKGTESNSNFYITSASGIQSMDQITATPYPAGMPRGLDITLELNGSSGFLTVDRQVAYRMVWGRKDFNQNLILGAPSQRVVLTNTGVTTADVDVNTSIPQGATTDWFFQAYRSAISAADDVDANDELQLVYEANPTSGDITAGYVEFTDSTPDDLRGASLYTNSSQQGSAQANNQPPAAKDLCLFKQTMVYANTIQKKSLNITMLSASGLNGVNYRSFTGDTTSTMVAVANVSDTDGLAVGQSISGTGIQAGTTIATIGVGTLTLSLPATATNIATTLEAFDVLTIAGTTYFASDTEDVSTRKFEVFTAGTPAQNIADTALSLVKVINRNSTNNDIYAYYNSGFQDLPGIIGLEARDFGAAVFSMTASSHGAAFNPSLPTSGTSVSSSAEERRNRLHLAKNSQPDACPLAQYKDLGAADKAILRVIPLRESCIVLKEDGFFRITGNTPADFNYDPLDTTAILASPETATALNNFVYCLTDQGVVEVSDTGVGIISDPIDDQFDELLDFANVMTVPYGIAYNAERAYILAVPDGPEDEFAIKLHYFNTVTRRWTHWEKPMSCGLQLNKRLYLGDGLTNKIMQERKSYDFTDYADDDLPITIISVDELVIEVSDTSDIEPFDVLTQGDVPYAHIVSVDVGAGTITMNIERPFVAGAAVVRKHYEQIVTWSPQYCGDPGIDKHIREVHPLFKNADFLTATLSFTSDKVFSVEGLEISGFPSFLWGYFDWGSVPWGGYSGLTQDRAFIPTEYQRCVWINTTFTQEWAYGNFAICGLEYIFEADSERTTTDGGSGDGSSSND